MFANIYASTEMLSDIESGPMTAEWAFRKAAAALSGLCSKPPTFYGSVLCAMSTRRYLRLERAASSRDDMRPAKRRDWGQVAVQDLGPTSEPPAAEPAAGTQHPA